MNGFSVISDFYDSFNGGARYDDYLDFIKERFNALSLHDPDYQPRVVDLACGTGEMTLKLAEAGFDAVGVDRSPQMLSKAMEKAYSHPQLSLFFVKQDMTRLSMDAKANLFVCLYDSLNYLEDEEALQLVFKKVSDHLTQGGIFIFDVNTMERFTDIYADNAFVFKRPDGVLIWECRYNKSSGICLFDVEHFSKTGDLYSRSHEILKQRFFSPQTVEKLLEESGFSIDSVVDDCMILGQEQPPKRHIYCAVKQF